MFNRLSATFLIIGMLFVIGCASHTHVVGNGAQGIDTTEARQWYILWGMVPINDVDTNAMAGGATDYEITTQFNMIDIVINAVVANVSILSRTVTVEK